MFTNLWNFLLKKKLSELKDDVLSVSDILPMKSMATSRNDSAYLSQEPAANADSQSGGPVVSGAFDSEQK